MAKRKDRPKRPNATGRNDKTKRFVMLPHHLLESAAYASLDLTGRATLQELMMMYNGKNNGSLWLSARDGTKRLGLSDCRPVLRALYELQDRGFITMAKDAHFSIKAADTSRARCWRLTWHAWPESPVRSRRAPTNEWERYEVPPGSSKEAKRVNQRAERRLQAIAKYRKDCASGRLPVVNLTTMEANMAASGADTGVKSTTAEAANDANLPIGNVVNSPPHIDAPWGRGSPGDHIARFAHRLGPPLSQDGK